MTMAPRDWPRLARYVRERRGELGLTQEDVAARGGPSTATIRLIETTGQPAYRQKSLRQLAEALGWTPDSPLAILGGREPQPASVPKPQSRPGQLQLTPATDSGRFTGSRERDAPPAGPPMGPIVQSVREDIAEALARAGIRGGDIFPDEDEARLWDGTDRLPVDARVEIIATLRRTRLEEEEPGNPGHGHLLPRRAG